MTSIRLYGSFFSVINPESNSGQKARDRREYRSSAICDAYYSTAQFSGTLMQQEIYRCREAVPELIAKAYGKYFAFWRNLARMSQVSDEDARDIVHSVLTNILARGESSFESLEHVRNYVAKSVLNRAIQIRQRSSRRIPLDEGECNIDSGWDEISAMERDEEKAALRIALRGLSARDFEIIKLRFFGGLTFAEIGHVMGMPVSTLKSREEAALRRIRKQLCASGIDLP